MHGAAPCEDDVRALYEPYEERLLSILDGFAEPKPFVLDAVARLREAGVRIGSTTGYNDKMMAIVEPKAAEAGYAPDFPITPDSVGGAGRPAPFTIFRNMEALGATDVRRVAKGGDTVSDIREGLAAGVLSIGAVEGSSEMGLSRAEYESLGEAERDEACARVAATFRAAGATAVVRTMSELPALLDQLA